MSGSKKFAFWILFLGLSVSGWWVVEGGAISRTTLRWNNACIDVALDNNIANRRGTIKAAIDIINDNTNACFFLLESFNDAPADEDWILMQASNSCSSFVGRQTGCAYQVIQLAPGCGVVSVMHELMHALGSWHEHQRPDRNLYVDIVYSNIVGLDFAQRQVNFDVRGDIESFGAYDYDSVMHYRGTAFASPGTKTVVAKLPAQQSRIDAQRTTLSRGDIATINELVKDKEGGTRPPPGPVCSPAQAMRTFGNSTSPIVLNG